MSLKRRNQLHTAIDNQQPSSAQKRAQYYKEIDTNHTFNIDGNSGVARRVDTQGSDKKSFHISVTGLAAMAQR